MLILTLLLRILSNPCSNAFQKKLTVRGHNPLTVNFISYLLLALACIVPATGIDWSILRPGFWVAATVGGMLGAAGNGFLIKSLQKGDLSVLGPVNAYKSVVGMLVAFLMLAELPTLPGVLGVAVVVWGSYYVFDATEQGFSWQQFRNPHIRYRLYAMVLTALEAVAIKQVINLSDTLTAFVAWCWTGALFSFILMAITRVPIRQQWKMTARADWALFAALALSVGTMQFSTNYVFRHMHVGYGLALFQLSTLVSVTLGWRLFDERGIRKKLAGTAIMIAGTALIILA